MIHKVPKQHEIERSGARAPTKRQKILFEKHVLIQKGLYTFEEDKIIRNNWEMFCKVRISYLYQNI